MSGRLRPQGAPTTVVSLAVILALAVVGLVALSSASTARSRGSRTRQSAAAKQPKCGDTITKDTTLRKDLVDCPNNGILIGADGVNLDLNGHVIDGDGTAFAQCPPKGFCDVGVLNDGHDGVTVMHGSVRQFDAGAFVGKARHNRLLGMSSSRNRFIGLNLARVRDLRVLRVSTTRNHFAGILCVRCVRSLVRNSAGNRTKGKFDQTGMLFFKSHHDRILHSSFRGNAGGGILAPHSTNTVIRGNLFSHNGAEGLFMEGSHGFRITHNRSVGNQGGIALGPGSENVIAGNRVFRDREGITITRGHGNLVADNVVAHTRAGIRLGIRGSAALAHNVVRRNLVRDSRKDGVRVGKKGRHSVLKGNVAKRSGHDGFEIKSRSAKLTSNRAVRNDDLGIKAVRGVIDGGGNIARHNGDPRQCTNIVCS